MVTAECSIIIGAAMHWRQSGIKLTKKYYLLRVTFLSTRINIAAGFFVALLCRAKLL